MALTDQGTSFSHVFSIILSVALLFLFLCFTLLALRHFKSLAQKIKLLIATAVRKRRQMATYGVKPNPRYFISQLQKQQKRQLEAEVQQKRESNFKIVLYYLYDIYNPVICVFHRCIKRRKERKQDQKRRNYLQRKMQESNRVRQEDEEEDYEGNAHGSNLNIQDLNHQAQIDLPAVAGRRSTNKLFHKRNYSSEKKESKLHRRKLEQKEESNELIQVDFLRPSKWFYVLQYMGGLSLTWFIILIMLAILYISTNLVQMSAALIIVISIVSAFLSCFAVIAFYWYSHKLYRTSIRQTFQKTYLSTLIQPLSKPRPTTGAAHQGINHYAMMSQIMYDHNYQLKQVKTMDAEMLGYKVQSRNGIRDEDDGVSNQKLRSLLATPPPQRAYSSGVVGLRGGVGFGLKSPVSTERNGLMDKNLYSNRLYQNEIEDQRQEDDDGDDDGLVKDGSGNNLLMNASGNEQILQNDQLIKSDMQGVFTKGEYAQIRRTSQEENSKIADNILLYILIGLMVFLVVGVQAILIVYLSTAFAVSSLASFFIASLLEIFLIRPFYVFLWTLIKRCSQKKKTQDEYDRIDDIKPPHQNPMFMDQVNEQAAMRQFLEQEKKFEKDNQGEDEVDQQYQQQQQQNKSGSGDGLDQDQILNNKIIDDENINKFQIEGKGEEGIDKPVQKIPGQIGDQNDQVIKAELAKDQNGDLIQLNSVQGQKNLDDDSQQADKIRLKSPDPDQDLKRVNSQFKNQPQSPFGAGMSNIPRKATASFDRRGEDQDEDIDRVAHIIVSPYKNLRSNDYSKEDDEAQGFRSLSPQNLRRNQDGIPGRKVDTKNQSYVGPGGSGDREDLSSPVLIPSSTIGGVLLTDKESKKKTTPQKQRKKDPKSLSGTKNRTSNSQFGGQFEGQDESLNDRSGEFPLKDSMQNQAIGGSAMPFSNQLPLPVYRDKHPVDQGVGDDEPIHQLMNEYAQTDLPPFVAGRKSPDILGQNRPVSRLSALSPFGEFSGSQQIPEQAQMSQMMMNPLDDLCPYKKVMTDVIYLSCGPEGGDQILRKLKKKPGAQDLSINDLQKIIDQNHYEVDPDHKSFINNDQDDYDHNADQTIQIKPGIKPVIPIDQHPAEDEITSSMPRSSVHGELPPKLSDSRQHQLFSQQQQDKKELTDSQLIENEMQIKQQEQNRKIPEQRGVDVSFAVNQDDQDPNKIFKVEAADGQEAGVGEVQNLDDEFQPPLEDSVLPIDDVNKSKSSMRYQPSPQLQEGQDMSRKSPSPVPSQRKSGSRVSSTKKSPSVTRTPSPKRVLMGAAIAPNAKKPSGKPKQKSFQLDMGDVSGTIIMSAESGGRTPPGIQASEGFFINGPDGSQELSPVGKNRSPILHGKKKKKKSISPLRAKPDSFRKGPKARGILATKPEDQNIEYDQGDHQDSQQIDPTIVYFKEGMGLPFDSQVSDQDYGDADIVYEKDDLTNYSKGLGINRVMNPGHLFGRKSKGKKSSRKPMAHSMYSDRLSSLGAQSEDEARYNKRPILNRSFRSTGSMRPASLGFTPNHRRTPYDPYGQKRVDCWNHDYIMMSELESKKPRKKKRFKKSPSYNYVQPHVYDHITNSKFYSRGGVQDDIGQMAALTFNNATLYRSGKKGKLPPLSGTVTSSSNRPRKNKRTNKKSSKDSKRLNSFEPIDMIFPDPPTNRSGNLFGYKVQSDPRRFQQGNLGSRFTDMSSGFARNHAKTASNMRGRQHDRSMQGSRILQDEDYDGTSPYNENLFRRFNQWEPVKESKVNFSFTMNNFQQSKRKHLNQIKAEQLSKNYGGPLQVTGIATCGGVRPSQRKKWQKQHRMMEMQRSHMFQQDYSINVQGSPLPNNNRLPSNRSSRSSLPPFPPQPQANFDPKTYKHYDSDSSIHQRRNNLNSSKLNRSGAVNNSSQSPIPRNQHSSVQSNRGLPRLPQNGGVMNNSAMKKNKKKKKTSQGGKKINRNYDPLFNPEQTEQKFVIDSEHHTYEQQSMRSDNPVENMASPVNFGSPGVVNHDDDEDEGMSDDVRFSSGIKQPTRQVNPHDLGLPPLPKQQTQDVMSQNDQAEVEDL